MSNNEIIITPEGRQKLVDELAYLEGEKSAEVRERLRVAREFGDLSENSEYDDATAERDRVQSRMAEIRRILTTAKVSEAQAAGSRSPKASIGSSVEVEDESGTAVTYTIVGTTETNSLEHRISNESPLGAALMGHKKGETVEYTLPSGKVRSLTIRKVTL